MAKAEGSCINATYRYVKLSGKLSNKRLQSNFVKIMNEGRGKKFREQILWLVGFRCIHVVVYERQIFRIVVHAGTIVYDTNMR